MLVNRQRPMSRDIRAESGSTLISVVVLMVVLSVLALVGGAIVMGTTRSVAATRQGAQARASADAGLSAAVAAFKRNEGCPGSNPSSSDPRYTTTCSTPPGSSKVYFTSTGKDASEKSSVTIEATYEYEVPSTGGAADGAIVSGDPTMNVSSISITAGGNDGHIVLNLGNFDCNNTMTMAGNLIVRGGSVSLSNRCHIGGNVYASGDVKINNANVKVDGDVIALGNFEMSYGTVVGDVMTAGTAKLPTSATVGGAVIAAGTGDSSFYQAKVGSIMIAGRFSSLQDTTVYGSVSSSRTGVDSSIAPTTTIGGSLTLAGTYSTWNSGPSVTGTKTTKAAGVVVPVVTAPLPLQPEGFKWIDYDFDPAEWAQQKSPNTELKYTVVNIPGCNFQDNPAFVATVNATDKPTVYNALGCSTLHLYGVTFNLKTDIVLVANKFESAQRLKINSSDSQPHGFSMITPDNVGNLKPTCQSNQGTLKIDDVLMGSKITGIAYSPCTVQFGQSGGSPSTWNGQIYAGSASWAGNTVPNMVLDYVPVELPGFVVAGTVPGESTGKRLRDLIRQRDVP